MTDRPDLQALVTAAVKFAHGGSEDELRAASAATLDAIEVYAADRAGMWQRLAKCALEAANSGQRVRDIAAKYGLDIDTLPAPPKELPDYESQTHEPRATRKATTHKGLPE